MMSTPPVIVGHRGAAAHVAENTLVSFRRAIDDGADVLECDVHLSADGHVIVMHDETIDRTADADSPLRHGALTDLDLEAIRQVRIGGGHPVPTLPELLKATTVPLFIEVKAVAAAQAVVRILEGLEQDHPASASTVISFHAEALAEIRRARPATPVSYLVTVLDEAALVTARELGAAGVGPAVDGLCLAAARAAREAGVQVNPWTINTEQQLAVALACEVDSITTDDPAWVRGRVAET